MVKLRIVNGIPEIDADPKEIASNQKEIVSLLRELNTPNSSPQTIIPNKEPLKTTKSQESNQIEVNTPYTPICDYPELPDRETIIKMLDSGMKPIKFSMRTQQLKIWGKVINSKLEKKLYWQIYSLHQEAMKFLAEKYKGKWDDGKNEKVDGVSQLFFTLIEDDENKSQSESLDSFQVAETISVVNTEEENAVNQD